MSQNEEGSDGTNLERTSFPLFRPKKSKMSSKTTKDYGGGLSSWGKTIEEGAASMEQLVDFAEDSVQEELTLRAMRRPSSGSEDGDQDSDGNKEFSLGLGSSGGDLSGGLNPYLMNPLMHMGLPLPQLALFMQQQQQQPQQEQQQQQQTQPHQPQLLQNPSNLNLPSSSSLLNPLMIPHLLPSSQTPGVMLPLEQQGLQQKQWLYGAPAPEIERPLLLDESQKGTIMGSTTNMRTMPRVMKGSKDVLSAQKEEAVSSTPSKQPFVCEICNDWFFSREKLVIHLVMNHEMQHCHFCSQLFESEDVLVEHEKQSHLPLECDTCKLSVPTSEELAEHYDREHDVRTCLYCGVLVKPKSYYEVHVRRKHFVCCTEALQQDVGERIRIVDKWDGQEGNSIWTFVCRLCGKERKRLETFGHFFSYHRLSLSCLIQLLSSEGIVFLVQGTPAPGSSNVQNPNQQQSSESAIINTSSVDASQTSGISVSEDSQQHHQHKENRRATSSPSVIPSRCTVCTNPYSVQVPKLAHDLFCRRSTRLALCKFCDRTFNSKTSRDSHVMREHKRLACIVTECLTDIVFTQETQLTAHYLTDHCIRVCRYCKSIVSTREDKYVAHLKLDHACSSSGHAIQNMDANVSGIELFHIQTYDNSVSVICSLCDADITSLMKDIIFFFRHLQHHKITLRLALNYLEMHPSCENVHVQETKTDSPKEKEPSEPSAANQDTLGLPSGAKQFESEDFIDTNSKGSKSDNRSKAKAGGQKSNSMKEKRDGGTDRRKGDSSELSKTRNGNSGGGESSGGDGKKSHGDGTDDPPFDSSSEISSEEEDLGSEADIGENEDLTEDDDEEYTVKETKSAEKKKNAPVPLAEMGEADIDPTEVECILTDSSDDDGEAESCEDDDNLVGLVADSEEPSNLFSSLKKEGSGKQGDKSSGLLENVDLLERTMQQLFQDENLQDVTLPEGGRSDHPARNELPTQSNLKKKGIMCELCRGKFSAKEGPRQLLDHLNTLHGYTISQYCTPKEFACTFVGCREVFSTQGSLSYHLSEVHQQEQKFIDAESFKIFQCPYCALHSTSKLAMRQHVFGFHRDNYVCDNPLEDLAHKCRFCQRIFWRTEDRDDHQVEVHKDKMDSFFKCYVCNHLFSSKVCMNRHVKQSHVDRPSFNRSVSYKCKMCLLTFPSIALMREHFRESHPTALVFHCRHCNTTLKTKKTLKTHIKNVHSEARRRDCSLCGKVLWSKRAHAIHYRMKHSAASKVGFRCRICQKRFDSKDERKLHYQVDHEGESPYHCAECGKGFASKSGMYGHRQLHTGSGVSKCQYCGKEFTRKDSYNEHLLIHNGPRHKCPHCPKEFVQRSNLVRHIRIHTGEKPYKCLYCEKCFSDKGACNSHIRVHTREETCSCPYCGQTFSKKQKLKYHIRKHTGEGLINCEICSKSFTNSFALKEHRVIHNRQTQILCQQCGKGFNSEKYLQRHVAIVHEPSHTFTCPLCPKAFSQQARLKAHLMTHTGVKHIKCLLCDKAYSVRKSLRRHLLEKHDISPDHPQYKHCFYAMSAAEAGLHIPEGVPTNISGEPTEDDDSTSQSSPKEEEEDKRKPTKKSPKKGTPGRKPSVKQPTTSVAFEDYSSIPLGNSGAQKGTKAKKSPAKKVWSKQTEDVAPGTSGQKNTKNSKQKISPKKPSKRDGAEIDPSVIGSGEENESCSSSPEVRKRGRPRKRRANSNTPATRVQPSRTKGSPARKSQPEPESEPLSSPVVVEPAPKSRNSPLLVDNIGSTRKKRRVEAIVEILQKSTGSPSGSSPKEEEEDSESETAAVVAFLVAPEIGARETYMRAPNVSSVANDSAASNNAGGVNVNPDVRYGNSGSIADERSNIVREEDKPSEEKISNPVSGAGYSNDSDYDRGGYDAVPTLARITPLITRNIPKKGVYRSGDAGKRYVPSFQISAARSSNEGEDEFS